MCETAHVAALDARPSHRRPLPVHRGRRGRTAPRAPSFAAEEPFLEVVRRQRRRRARLRAAPRRAARRGRGRAPARRLGRSSRAPRRLAVPDPRVRRRVARLVRPSTFVFHCGGSERNYLIEAKRDPVLPLALVDLLGSFAIWI